MNIQIKHYIFHTQDDYIKGNIKVNGYNIAGDTNDNLMGIIASTNDGESIICEVNTNTIPGLKHDDKALLVIPAKTGTDVQSILTEAKSLQRIYLPG